MANPLAVRQPPPVPNDQPAIQPQVHGDLRRLFAESTPLAMLIDALEERHRDGVVKYGTSLQPNNGRDCVIDAIQEKCDAANYLKQALQEGKTRYQAAYEIELASLAGLVEGWFVETGISWSPS